MVSTIAELSMMADYLGTEVCRWRAVKFTPNADFQIIGIGYYYPVDGRTRFSMLKKNEYMIRDLVRDELSKNIKELMLNEDG